MVVAAGFDYLSSSLLMMVERYGRCSKCFSH